jgi:hypothetical protein
MIPATTRPTTIPISVTTEKSTSALCQTNVPVSTAANANRKTIKLDASLIRLSPSRMATSLLGTLIPFKTDVAATASGGEMIPPSRNPRDKVNPGMSASDTNATTQEVIITRPKAKTVITLLHRQNSFHEVFHAAS